MEILHFEDLGDTSVVSECSLGVNLVIDIFYVASDYSPLYTILKRSDHYLWRYCSLKIWGIQVSSANAVGVLTLSGSTGGGRGGRGDAKTIISPNTSFGDIISANSC